jgi:gliding motility-associated-like protein
MKSRLSILVSLFVLGTTQAIASHIVGGEVNYVYIGDTLTNYGIARHYRVSLSIYEDCLNGDPTAIAQDDPAFLGVFDLSNKGAEVELDTAVFAVSSITVPTNFNNACVTNVPATCLKKRTFVQNYYLPPNADGYIVAYQRCCRNATIKNIINPGAVGATYYCTIPGAGKVNNSAVFKNYPPQIICVNNPLVYDNSATDPDGDSLSYEFCNTYQGGDDSRAKPFPSGPPYAAVTYVNPYSFTNPISGVPAIQINPTTGLITGTPVSVGRYLVTVCCDEWRGGEIINTVKREFQFVITDCSKAVIADMPQYSTDYNTYIVDCANYTVNFQNTSKGGFAYHWDFGIPEHPEDTSDAFEPTFTYPDTGTYIVKLTVNPGSTCPDSIWRYVKVFPYFRTSYSDTGLMCPGSSIAFTDLTASTYKPIVSWTWNFGDGDTSMAENPTHAYPEGGVYNVTLIAQNVQYCVDTFYRQVLIENFRPFAGDDTSIVKGSSVYFNAAGGTRYAWSPGINLNDTSIYDPVGYYPDTGKFGYNVFVTSAFGCSGSDSVYVTVVGQPVFVLPDAFTPNGDGKNDYFKPISIGYSAINYFQVFDRFGELVYRTQSLEGGWDGTYMGQKLPIGTYYWEISYTDRNGIQNFLKGDVALIR